MPEVINGNFTTDKNLSENTPIMLYEIQLNDGAWLYLCEWSTAVVYPTSGGQTYLPFPLGHEGVSTNAMGEIDAIKVHLSAVDRSIISVLETNNGLLGNQVNMKLVFADMLADPSANIEMTLYIDSVETTEMEAAFVLTTKLDLWEVKLPSRMMMRNSCPWKYMQDGCWINNGDGTYTPRAAFTNQAVSCDKTIDGPFGCQFHTNQNSDTSFRFGAFPGIPMVSVFMIR